MNASYLLSTYIPPYSTQYYELYDLNDSAYIYTKYIIFSYLNQPVKEEPGVLLKKTTPH